jgi:hypothetical protein
VSATFELYEDKEGKYRWRLRHANGNSVERSSTGSQPATAG